MDRIDLRKECAEASKIGISGHIRPDGDCVGSCLALFLYLKKIFPEKEVRVFLEKPAEIFADLKGFSEIDTTFQANGVFDVFFCLDCGKERLGGAQVLFEQAGKKIQIDHHLSSTGCGDLNRICPKTGSCSELIYDLLDKEYLDKEIAEAIYTGMIHDTGVFQYSNTSPETLKKAAELITFGFDFPKLIQETFYQKTYLQTQILGRALLQSIRFMDGQCIVSGLDRKTLEFYQAVPADLDGIVNQLRNIEGIHCALFLYETDVLEYKVSLRSDESVDVSKVASYFGGGGHMRAAGCTMKGTFHDCVNNLSAQIAVQLEGQK